MTSAALKTSVVVTSIASPNQALRELAVGCAAHGQKFLLVGDVSSPKNFELEGCDFYDIERQKASGLITASRCPTRHYARKNIGYLLAMREGSEIIVETDDDNLPLPEFWSVRRLNHQARLFTNTGWINAYSFFSDAKVWPRGFPLDSIDGRPKSTGKETEVHCPIQQGLADDNPDVDAIYRMIMPLPIQFRKDPPIAVGGGALCPFNSQNTTWFKDAFPLLYLPSNCSFRMTDIWRSFVAQRIAAVNDWPILFHSATVRQERNYHDLMRDFQDEMPGYLYNRKIVETLQSLALKPGKQEIFAGLWVCYEAFISLGLIAKEELELLRGWCQDLRQILDT